MTTEERVEVLERELARGKRLNRLLVAAVVLIVGGLGLAWTLTKATPTAQAQEPGAVAKTLRANEFILEDAAGKPRARLAVTRDGPALWLSDENGNHRAALAVLKDGPGLTLHDEKGDLRAWLAVTRDGPGLAVYDEKSKLRAWLLVNKDGPGLGLDDEKGKPRALLTAFKDGPGLSLHDEKGNTRATLGAQRTTGVGEPDGKVTVHPESSLLLYGADGKVIWEAPR